MKQRAKHESIKLRYGSLYTVIEDLKKRGYIAAKERRREGARPERTVFRLTPAKEYPQFEAGLCLLPALPPDEALALLRERLAPVDDMTNSLAAQCRGVGEAFFSRSFWSRTNTGWRAALCR